MFLQSCLFFIHALEKPAVPPAGHFQPPREQTLCSRRGKHQLRSDVFFCQSQGYICLSQKEQQDPLPVSTLEVIWILLGPWGSRPLLGTWTGPCLLLWFCFCFLQVNFYLSVHLLWVVWCFQWVGCFSSREGNLPFPTCYISLWQKRLLSFPRHWEMQEQLSRNTK